MLQLTKTKTARQGFTLIELLMISAILALLAIIQRSVLANSKAQSKGMTCLENAKKLARGWMMYAEDHNGLLVFNVHGGDAQGGASKVSWAAGWLDWSTSTDNTNILFLVDERWAKLSAYVNKDPRVFKCPSDNFVSSAQRSRGWTGRVRSYAMNSCMGASKMLSDGQPSVSGTLANKQWYGTAHTIYMKLGDLKKLAPMNAWVFLDEQADSINGPCFFVNPTQASWVDLPASYHNGAGVFGFADGHVELKKWFEQSTMVPVMMRSFSSFGTGTGRDWRWVVERTSEKW